MSTANLSVEVYSSARFSTLDPGLAIPSEHVARRKPEKHDPFAADSSLIQALEKRSQPVACIEGRILFAQGETPSGVYILKSGEATLMMKSASGNVVMCLHAAAGSLLGLPAVIADEPYTLTAMALKGSEVRFLARNDFEFLIQAEPLLFLKVLRVVAAEVRSARQAFSEI